MSRPGPKRPQLLDETERAQLLAAAADAGQRGEQARQAMLAAAVERQDAIAALQAGGVSVRDIAGALGCSATVVSTALAAARDRAGRG